MTRSKDNTFTVKTTPLGAAISRKNKREVLELVREGGLEQDEGLLARLVGEMSSEVYMEAIDKVGNLSPEAVGLGIVAALQRDDIIAAKSMLWTNPNANLNVQNENGVTALMVAVANDLEGFLKYTLLASGNIESLDVQDNVGYTALVYAIMSGGAKCIDLLIENGADLNIADKEGKTPVMIALEQGRIDLANILIDRGAKLEVKDKDGKTALMLAVKEGELETVKFLIKKGADPYLAGLIKVDNGVAVIDERVADKGMRDVLLGYVQAEKEFEKKFANRIVEAIKGENISFSNVNNKIQEIVTKVLKEEGKGKFAHAVRQGAAEAPKIELAFTDKFIIALQAILPNSWVEKSMQAVKEQLNAAVQRMEVFKPLSAELGKELKSFAQNVKSGQGEIVLGG